MFYVYTKHPGRVRTFYIACAFIYLCISNSYSFLCMFIMQRTGERE